VLPEWFQAVAAVCDRRLPLIISAVIDRRYRFLKQAAKPRKGRKKQPARRGFSAAAGWDFLRSDSLPVAAVSDRRLSWMISAVGDRRYSCRASGAP